MTAYGAEQPCQRTACQTEPPHLGGEHIDPRSPRYDGPEITFGALPAACRRAAFALRAAGAPVPEVVELAREILRLREQIAHVRVDADRQVRAALARSASCEAHGAEIAELAQQLHAASQRAERNDRGRVALLALPHALEDLPDGAVLTAEQARAAARRALAAHERGWR